MTRRRFWNDGLLAFALLASLALFWRSQPPAAPPPPPSAGLWTLDGRPIAGAPAILRGSQLRTDRGLLQVGELREAVRQRLGPPVGYNDAGSKWGYWTQGLPDKEMGVLVEFRGEQVVAIRAAGRWSLLVPSLMERDKPGP